MDPSLSYSGDNLSPSLVIAGGVPLAERIDNKMRGRKSIPKKEMELFILDICSDRFQTLGDIALILHRTEKAIRENYIRPMVQKGLLIPRYPEKKTHPDQAYIRKTTQ